MPNWRFRRPPGTNPPHGPHRRPAGARQLQPVSSKPTAVKPAAAHPSDSNPKPCDSTSPPTQAPSALPRLKAEMFRLEARLAPAAPACYSTRICIGATVAKATVPSSTT